MRRLTVTAIVVAAFAAASCGAEDTARDAVDPVAEAAARTAAAGGARFEGTIVYKVEGEEIPSRLSGVVDFANERSRTLMRFEAFGPKAEREAGFPDERIRDGLTIYLTTPLLRDEIDEHWAKVDLEGLGEEYGIDTEMLGSWDESDPQDLLRFLEAAGGAVEAGRERVGGVMTTRYDAQVSIARYAELVTADADPEFRRGFSDGLREQLGSETIETSVWLDDDGLIRRELLEFTLTIEGEQLDASMRLNFSDFSDRHEIDVPDEDDVKDVSDEFGRYKVHFTG
jgi:hypothetical protein